MTALPMVLMTDDEIAGFGRDPDAGFGALQTERGLLPLTAMSVEARVAGVVAAIDVAQTFVNTTGVAIEATYIFPLPDRAAVRRFQMEVAGRVIDGVIDERGAARQQYDEAIAAGHRAAITEEERPGVFTLRVGNLLPGEAATVKLGLVGALPVDDGEATFRFPLVVAPRYMPGAALGGDQAGLGTTPDTDVVPDASRISPPVRLPGCPNPVRLAIKVALEDHAVRDVRASLHAVTSTLRDAHVIEVQPGERLDRDFILRWHVDGAALRSTLVCQDDADGAGGTFAVTLVPPSTTTLATKPRDVVFVLDRSGSMGGWKMVAARRAAARMIDSLTSRDRFSAIAFDNTCELVPGAGLVDATDRNRFRAVEALAKIDARGGTELAEPLRLALAQLAGGTRDRKSDGGRARSSAEGGAEVDAERVIVLVTDGQVGNEDHILRELAGALRGIKVFTLGIDQAVNAGFLRRLAAAGGGLCELVESEDRLDAVMAKVHRRIGTPVATELALDARGLEVDRASVSPAKLPDVYAGAPVTIFGRYRGRAAATASVELVGTTLGDPLQLTAAREPAGDAPQGLPRAEVPLGLRPAVDPSPSVASAWLAACWARARIRDLEDAYATGTRGEVEAEIVATSKRFGVLSRFTAYLAVDRSQVANAGGKLHQVVQPVDSPAGWEMYAAMPPPPPMLGRAAPAPAPAAAAPAMYDASVRARGISGVAPMVGRASAATSGGPGAPMRPAPKAAAPAKRAKLRREAASDEGGALDAMPVATAAYLETLGALAKELEAQARGRVDAAAIRVLRQRLVEWVEDVRSVGSDAKLADAVEALVRRLSAALAGTSLAAEALAVAGELATLAGAPTSPKPSGRVAFWK
jgi:Ca-activated chloride channel family protein